MRPEWDLSYENVQGVKLLPNLPKQGLPPKLCANLFPQRLLRDLFYGFDDVAGGNSECVHQLVGFAGVGHAVDCEKREFRWRRAGNGEGCESCFAYAAFGPVVFDGDEGPAGGLDLFGESFAV